MSQIYKSVSSTPSVPTSFVTDSGTAVPSGNVLNVVTPGSGSQGITTIGSGNTITIELTESLVIGTCTTVGTTPNVLNQNIAIPANSTTSFRVNISGYDSTNGLGAAAEILAGMRNVGGTLTLLGAHVDTVINADASINTVSFNVISSGTNAQIQITGPSGHTIDWKGLIETVNVS